MRIDRWARGGRPRRALGALGGLALCWLAAGASAAPNLLTYQGRLKESGVLVNSPRSIEIVLCNIISGGVLNTDCFATGVQSVTVTDGVFRTTFTVPGSVNLESGPWFLEVQVGGLALSPREKLTSAPYALSAATATWVAAGGVRPGVLGTGIHFADNVNVQGNAFSVGGTTFVVKGGSIGIGTTNPGSKLHVENGGIESFSTTGGTNLIITNGTDSQFNVDIAPVGAGDKRAQVGSGVVDMAFYAGAERMRIVAGSGHVVVFSTLSVQGNAFSVGGSSFAVTQSRVGIGTSGPLSRLHIVDGDVRISTTVGNRGIIFQDGTTQNTAASAANSVSKAGDTMTGQLTLAGSTLTVTGGAFSVGGSALVVTSGRVGIGTTNPSTFLQIINTGAAGVPGAVISRHGTTGGGQGLHFLHSAGSEGSPAMAANGDPVLFISAKAHDGSSYREIAGIESIIDGPVSAGDVPGNLRFYTARAGLGGITEKMRITGGGSVGIGGIVPAATLHVSSPAGFGFTPILIVSSGAAAGQELMRVAKNGSVGIGTDLPMFRLEVAGNGGVMVRSSVTIDGAGVPGGQRVLDVVNGTFTVTMGGRVGIGTTNPQMRLHVSGGPEDNGILLDPGGFVEWGVGGPFINGDLINGLVFGPNAGPSNFNVGYAPNGNFNVGFAGPGNARLHVSSAGATATESVLVVSSGTQTGQELLVVKGNGRIGVGTAGPTELFHVAGRSLLGGKVIAGGAGQANGNLAGCGTATVAGTDSAGRITFGGSPTATCTLTFTASWSPAAPVCFANKTNTPAVAAVVSAVTATSVDFMRADGGFFAGTDVLDYFCVGR